MFHAHDLNLIRVTETLKSHVRLVAVQHMQQFA